MFCPLAIVVLLESHHVHKTDPPLLSYVVFSVRRLYTFRHVIKVNPRLEKAQTLGNMTQGDREASTHYTVQREKWFRWIFRAKLCHQSGSTIPRFRWNDTIIPVSWIFRTLDTPCTQQDIAYYIQCAMIPVKYNAEFMQGYHAEDTIPLTVIIELICD